MINFLKKQDKATDLVCFMKVEKSEKAITYKYKERTYYFCSENCKEQFKQEPDKFLS